MKTEVVVNDLLRAEEDVVETSRMEIEKADTSS